MKDDIVVDRSPLIAQYLPQELRGSSSNRQPKGHAGGTPKPNRKQAVLQHNLELRKKFESMVLQWQEILCDPVDEQTLGEAVGASCFFGLLHVERQLGDDTLQDFTSTHSIV
jgi:hypothetical protein